MKDNENQIRKVCGFYVNNSHLTAMMLPYICKEIENENKIITVLQNQIESNIKELLSKMNLNQKLQEQILEINWKKNYPIKYSKIKEKIQKENGQTKNINILINGEKEFIQNVNEIITKLVEDLEIQKEITIINCYNITQFSNANQIMEEHEYILNTYGIRKINEECEIK